MKKLWILLVTALLLAGCGQQPVMETVEDVYRIPAAAKPQQILVDLPKEAAMPVAEASSGKLYICEDHVISQQTLSGGDMERTVQSISGFSGDRVAMLSTEHGAYTRYDLTWVAAGELEAQVCRACILDDGDYHYVLTATTGASCANALQAQWRDMFRSFRLVSNDMPIHTGS